MDQGDVVVAADYVAEGGEALFDADAGDGAREGGADVCEFLVRGGGREEETFAVAGEKRVLGDRSWRRRMGKRGPAWRRV